MKEQDANVELAKRQKQILEYLGVKAENLVFDFNEEENQVVLNLVTINPRHNQSFLFHSEKGISKVDAANKMYLYVRDYKDKENSYTIQWMKHGEQELHTSYFSAKNIYEALDKLNFGRDMNTINVFSVTLNPKS